MELAKKRRQNLLSLFLPPGPDSLDLLVQAACGYGQMKVAGVFPCMVYPSVAILF